MSLCLVHHLVIALGELEQMFVDNLIIGGTEVLGHVLEKLFTVFLRENTIIVLHIARRKVFVLKIHVAK